MASTFRALEWKTWNFWNKEWNRVWTRRVSQRLFYILKRTRSLLEMETSSLWILYRWENWVSQTPWTFSSLATIISWPQKWRPAGWSSSLFSLWPINNIRKIHQLPTKWSEKATTLCNGMWAWPWREEEEAQPGNGQIRGLLACRRNVGRANISEEILFVRWKRHGRSIFSDFWESVNVTLWYRTNFPTWACFF